MRFAINFLLGVLILITLMLSVPSHAKEGCDFGLNPDGTCRDVCQFYQSNSATRTLRWFAYIYGPDVKNACFGSYKGTRCGLNLGGSTACVGVGDNGEILPDTSCVAKFTYTGSTCTAPDFSGGTVPKPPTPDPDPEKPKPPTDNTQTTVRPVSVVGFGTLGSQIYGAQNAINNQIARGWGRLEDLGHAQMTQDKKQNDRMNKLMVDMGSTVGMVASGISDLKQQVALQKQTPWTEKTLKELIDGIKILSDCTKTGKIIDPTNGTETPCIGSSNGSGSGGGGNGGTDLTTTNKHLSEISDMTGLTTGRIFGLQRSNEMMSNWIGETLEGIKDSGKKFTKPAKPEFKTPFKDGVEGLKTEITQLEKDIETKLSQSPLKMGTMHFSSGSYKGTQFDLDHHGHRISVGFNLLNTLAPHLDLIKGVIIFIATLTAAFIVLSSGRNS
ncbi:hypothetical protein OPW07_25640 [Vibrio europaeus]|uniref:hypothetical protein n=1 Tax=Vibrio europaeus TaxID=300876 RepID=UPI0018A7AF92|nr:hypothetical protein [Vibrio europaeus]MDC5813104.1 hypothetical protein [Vibrio europaeus]QPG34135.1 hypothetical protein IXK98_08485 [Vibrio europaeus]